jgi:hypothetical protein
METTDSERATKARQTAQQLLLDLRDLHAKTDSMAVEELTSQLIQQTAEISRILNRLI